MRVTPGVVTVLLAASSFVGLCQQQSPNPCNDPRSTIQMQECAAFELKNAEKDLESVYSSLLSELTDEGHKKLFVASQEAWLRYRDAGVEFESYFYTGGTIQLQIRLDSKTRMTRARTYELRQQLKDGFDH